MRTSLSPLSGHLALRGSLGFTPRLDRRTRALVVQLAAEGSGCRWCVERGRHEWRCAGLPPILLRRLDALESSPLLDERERAACRFAGAVLAAGAGALPEDSFPDARRHFSEYEIADIVGCLADHHCLDEPCE